MREICTDFPCSEKQAIQYKYEIADRLNRYYLSYGKPIKFVFYLVHQKNDGIFGYEEADYPSCNSYLLKVSLNKENLESIKQKRLLIEKTLAEVVDAEWEAYNTSPEINLTSLDKVFDVNSPAYKVICQRVKRNNEKSWTLQNHGNPSTKRLIDVKIEEMTETTARARTSEYWFLNYWSIKNQRYEHFYKELNRQTYILVWKGERWLVSENITPSPKVSTPRRNIKAAERED
jgi:hypothetical protein